MENWNDYSIERHGGTFLIEFSEDDPKQAYLSWSQPMSPDDPDDDAQTVVMLGCFDGEWKSRDAAISECMAKADELLKEAGYPC